MRLVAPAHENDVQLATLGASLTATSGGWVADPEPLDLLRGFDGDCGFDVENGTELSSALPQQPAFQFLLKRSLSASRSRNDAHRL